MNPAATQSLLQRDTPTKLNQSQQKICRMCTMTEGNLYECDGMNYPEILRVIQMCADFQFPFTINHFLICEKCWTLVQQFLEFRKSFQDAQYFFANAIAAGDAQKTDQQTTFTCTTSRNAVPVKEELSDEDYHDISSNINVKDKCNEAATGVAANKRKAEFRIAPLDHYDDFDNIEDNCQINAECNSNASWKLLGEQDDSSQAAGNKMERRHVTYGDISRVLAELEREEAEENSHEEFIEGYVSDDPDYEPEGVEQDIHDSGSEIDLENEEENEILQEPPADDLRFYIGKDMQTIWASRASVGCTKTKQKNIIKTPPGPIGHAARCKTRLECFLCKIKPEIIESIVKYTNIYIDRKKLARQSQAGGSNDFEVLEGEYRPTTTAEILALFGALFFIATKRGNRAKFFNNNETGLTILRANFSLNRFRFLLRAIRFDDLNTRSERRLSTLLPTDCLVRSVWTDLSPDPLVVDPLRGSALSSHLETLTFINPS